jgi:hypothetical protein
MQGEEITDEQEDELGEIAALQGVRQFPVRIKCALLGWTTLQDAIAEYVNVPVENFAPYVESLDSFEYVAEPLVASQEIYAALDPVVQAVLTDKNADIDALLTDAEARVNTILEQNQE